ncbi:MAG: CCA tRNA nucleotidyltransferase, partial [Actinomycetota bacterium]|nr:CCA tRNA nucleotidyltransferase [Actinomycetota bacterium]
MTESTPTSNGAVIEVDPLAKELGERFAAAGFQLYLVGGFVRDLVLGRVDPDGDLDFSTDASPHDVTRLLRGWADRRYL